MERKKKVVKEVKATGNKKTVVQKILEIQKKIADIPEKDWDWDEASLNFGSSKYKYRSFHTLMEKIGGFLRSEGLVLKFDSRLVNLDNSLEIIQEKKILKTGAVKETTSRLVRFIMEATITESDDLSFSCPYKVSIIAFGEDNQDVSKALGKASTYAKRYLLSNIFAISDKEETVEKEAEKNLLEEKKSKAKMSVKMPDDFTLLSS